MANNPLTKLCEALQMYELQDAEKQAEIDRLKAENQELTERVRNLEEQLKVKSDQSQNKRSNDDSIMKMYEAQAIAIEKQMEVDKLKEEMNELKEKIERLIEEKEFEINKLKKKEDDLMDILKRLGKDQEVLSVDRTKWIKTNLKLPLGLPRAVVYLDNELYLIDAPKIGATTNALYKLDRTLKWTRLADMNEERWYIRNSCLVENGYIWVCGGEGRNSRPLAGVERYDPKEDKWSLMSEMKHHRRSAAATAWNNSVVISGGNVDFPGKTNSVECFNPETGSWTELPNMPNALTNHSLVSYKNKLILMGGFADQRLPDVWQLDPLEANPKWKSLPSMKHPSSSFAGIVFDEEIYAIGGVCALYEYLDQVEIFDGKDWRDGPPLLYPMGGTSAMIIPQHFADRLCNL